MTREAEPAIDVGLGSRPARIREVFTSRGSRRWYIGGLVGLSWLPTVGTTLFAYYPGTTERAVGIALLVVFGLGFIVLPLLGQALPPRYRLLAPVGMFALTFMLVPLLGWGVSGLWVYPGVVAAMSLLSMRRLVVFVLAVAALALWFQFADGARGETLLILPLVIVSISLMMGAFARQIRAVQQLRATRHELARLAVEQERNRVARDLHDILGHSLTVIAVKAELAGRLIEVDPARAAAEISELEDLARGALADVRSTAAGYRGVSVAAELANARSALESAGIRAELPGSADEVPAESRELFGWVVREGVTNVVRHSGAERATVRLGPDFVEIVDDGRGPSVDHGDGTGLGGLRERADAAGCRMTVGRSDSGGFLLRVSR